ncbi:MAG: dipeptidase PepE [Bacteroidota bacterium]|jgi:dipeptidase E|nr:MAG: dipeptidase PepE [Bacteroidota bacterium]
MPRLLLLSNSTLPGAPFLAWPEAHIRDVLGDEKGDLLFIPFAAVTFSYQEYTDAVRRAFASWGYSVSGIHEHADYHRALQEAAAIVVGGGNTFVLLNQLYHHDLITLIREKVRWGLPYIGWSAGANVACPTIMTTNDMPIVKPLSFEALDLVPFQINPHFTDQRLPNHGGESRRQRLEEYLAMNPGRPVIGLPEGMLIDVFENRITLKGDGTAFLFQSGGQPVSLTSGADLSHLLRL